MPVAPAPGAVDSGCRFGYHPSLYAKFLTHVKLLPAVTDSKSGYPTMKKIFALLVLASMGQVAAAQEVVGNATAAKAKVEMCIGCHGIPGYKAAYPEVYRVPMLGGQNAKYIEAALRAYKKGERKNASMRGIAITLTEQDIADVAAYYAEQPSTAAKK